MYLYALMSVAVRNQVSDAGISALGAACGQLESINIYDSHNFTAECLTGLGLGHLEII